MNLSTAGPLAVSAKKAPELSLEDRALLFEMLAVLTSAGVPLLRALGSLRGQPSLARPLADIVRALESGHSLARSFFISGFSDPMIVGFLQLGERTGMLDRAIAELAGSFRWRARLKSELRASLAYPALLAASCALMVSLGPPLLLRPILDFLVVSGAPLPFVTWLMLGLVQALSSPWFWAAVPPVLALLAFLGRHLWQRLPESLERRFLSQGAAGECLRLLHSLRFSKALLSGLSAGLPLLGALELAACCSGSRLVESDVRGLCARLAAGETPETAFESLSSLDPLLRKAVPLGLASGAVEALLLGVQRLSEERFRHAIERTLALLEPVLLAIMGLAVAGCIFATVAPMMSLLQGIT